MSNVKISGKCDFKFSVQKSEEKLSPKDQERWVKRNLKAALKSGNIIVDQFNLEID